MHFSTGISTFLSIPSSAALAVCAIILIFSKYRSVLSKNFQFGIFFISILCLNLIEFLTIAKIVSPNVAFMKLYYVFLVFTLISLSIISGNISGLKIFAKNQKSLKYIAYAASAFLSSGLLFTNYIINGIEITQITVTRIPGPGYFIAQLFFLATLVATISFLLIGCKNTNSDFSHKKAKIVLFSFTPLVVSLFTILVFMQFGMKVNATFIVPLSTTFLLLALINSERKESLYKILLNLPFTSERQSYQSIVNEIETFISKASGGHQSSLKDLTNSLEQHIVKMAMDISNGSQVQAASLLNTSASSICRKKKTDK